MHDEFDRRPGHFRLFQPVREPDRLVAGCRGHFGNRGNAFLAVRQNHVGEGTADVDADQSSHLIHIARAVDCAEAVSGAGNGSIWLSAQRATEKSVVSAKGAPTSWIPSGKPSWLSPLGSVMAGQPIKVHGTWQKCGPIVLRSGAPSGFDGTTMASTPSSSDSNRVRTRARTRCA